MAGHGIETMTHGLKMKDGIMEQRCLNWCNCDENDWYYDDLSWSDSAWTTGGTMIGPIWTNHKPLQQAAPNVQLQVSPTLPQLPLSL